MVCQKIIEDLMSFAAKYKMNRHTTAKETRFYVLIYIKITLGHSAISCDIF